MCQLCKIKYIRIKVLSICVGHDYSKLSKTNIYFFDPNTMGSKNKEDFYEIENKKTKNKFK